MIRSWGNSSTRLLFEAGRSRFRGLDVEEALELLAILNAATRLDHISPLKSVGRPIYLDTIACDFPELKLVGIHTGWPWVEEMISVSWKHQNVYIGTDAYAPKYWKRELINFINSWGQDKVMFGTDFPIIDFERATREVGEIGFKEACKEKLLWKNAARLYGLTAKDGF